MSISIFNALFHRDLHATLDLLVQPNPNAILGCTYLGASNFNDRQPGQWHLSLPARWIWQR